jgi:CheY-like chemotaxis protein
MHSLGGRLSSIPVIAVTAHAGAENEARALSAGFKMHCSKPLDPDTVARAVLKIVGKADVTNARTT